jgi:hypothetical protein
MSRSEFNVTLPTGRLSLFEDGTALATLRVSIRNREAALAAIASLSGLDSNRFWLSSSFKQDAEGLHLSYAKPAHEVTPLTQVVRQWRDEPALYLGRVLDLARQLVHATGELEQLGPLGFHLSPVHIFSVRTEAGKEGWRVLPLPMEGATFADFVRADDDCWVWLSSDELLGAMRGDRAYALGATLYYCLIADLFPQEISRAERIRRSLLYRVGHPSLAREVLAGALPKSQVATANRLFDFIMGLLCPSLGRPLTAAQASGELDRFYEELSPHRLSCQWELEGPTHVSRARKILEAFVHTVPEYEVPWETLERLREKDGDPVAAADATARRYSSTETFSVINRVRELIDAGDERKPELDRLTSTLRETVTLDQQAHPKTHRLSEEEYLYLAYANGRRLGRPDEALLWLKRDFSVSWHKVLYRILVSRLLADKADWREVLQNCREGRRLVSKLPDTGGTIGRYADAYLDLLYGIAHICAVYQQSYSQDYLHDAFTHLGSAWINLQRAEAEDLSDALISWLSWLGELASRNPQLTMLGLGVEAFLHTFGALASQRQRAGSPPIPWFDEAKLFTR